MKGKKNHLPNKIKMGKVRKSQMGKPPDVLGSGGRINTKLEDIRWTPKKLWFVSLILVTPMLMAIVGAAKAGNYLIAIILLGLLLFVGLMYLMLRYIDNNEF